MGAVWKWLDFPGWWRGVTRPTSYKALMGATCLGILSLALAGAYIMMVTLPTREMNARIEAECEAQTRHPMSNGWTPETWLPFCRALRSGTEF
jgi:hypothetical protein